MLQLRFQDNAKEQLFESVEYYEQIEVGLGKRFQLDLDSKMKTVRQFPEIAQTTYEEFRGISLKEFPYTVFYDFDDKYVDIYAVAHQARKPGFWLG